MVGRWGTGRGKLTVLINCFWYLMNLSLSALLSEAGLAVEGLFVLKDSLRSWALLERESGLAVDGRARVREDDCGLMRPGGKLIKTF